MTNYNYTITLKHEKEKYNRELNMDDFDSAENTFNRLSKALEEELGNFTLELCKNDEKGSVLLKKLVKDY
jgi:hypothetical protein